MREILAIISILILMLPILFVPNTDVIDSRVIDAAFAENFAWMESEITLPRYLSFIRCLIDEWLVNNYGKDVDEVELPSIMNTDEWRVFAENESKSRGIRLYANVTPLKLGRSLSANERQNKAFAGRCRPGAIGVQSSLSILIISSRGFAEAIARRDYSISVCHPCLYFLIKEVHVEIEEELEKLFENEVMMVGARNDFAAAASLLKSMLSNFDEEISRIFLSKEREYSSKGIKIEFCIEKKVSISRNGDRVELCALYKLHMKVWDKEVLYWAGNLRKGWYLKNDFEFRVRMICKLLKAPKRTLTQDSQERPKASFNPRERRILWPATMR